LLLVRAVVVDGQIEVIRVLAALAVVVGLPQAFRYRAFLLLIIPSVLAALAQQQTTRTVLLAVKLGLIRRQTQPRLLAPMAHWPTVAVQD
jgi:hypothetical protein